MVIVLRSCRTDTGSFHSSFPSVSVLAVIVEMQLESARRCGLGGKPIETRDRLDTATASHADVDCAPTQVCPSGMG